MKKALKMVSYCLLAFFMISCQSKEDKAAKLIKNELAKTLYDFESYQPIETIVTEAKLTMFNDSACWKKAAMIAYGMSQADEYIEKAQRAKEEMDIWGSPTAYSTSYSDNQYYKHKEEFDKNYEEANTALDVCQQLANDLKKQISKLDTVKVIGWEVKHRFRCKTKGGDAAIGDYRYVIDKDFKNMILREDIDDDDDISTRKVLESAVNGGFDD